MRLAEYVPPLPVRIRSWAVRSCSSSAPPFQTYTPAKPSHRGCPVAARIVQPTARRFLARFWYALDCTNRGWHGSAVIHHGGHAIRRRYDGRGWACAGPGRVTTLTCESMHCSALWVVLRRHSPVRRGRLRVVALHVRLSWTTHKWAATGMAGCDAADDGATADRSWCRWGVLGGRFGHTVTIRGQSGALVQATKAEGLHTSAG